MLYLNGKVRKLDLIIIGTTVLLLYLYIKVNNKQYEEKIKFLELKVGHKESHYKRFENPVVRSKYRVVTNYDKIDWHDYKFMEYEKTRVGPGEQGAAYYLTNAEDLKHNQQLYNKTGFYALASDHISVNRSVPDIRDSGCKSKLYLRHLPKVSIIVIFYDEYWSILLRTIHGLINRTPKSLLHEVILVNDNSLNIELYEPLSRYVKRNFNGKVRLHYLNERKGLIVARMEGAKIATGEVLVFIDAHVEVNVNWLPPLLEPIALSPRIITTPLIDYFAYDTFEYRKIDDGGRGIFNWDLLYRRFPRRPEDLLKLDNPIPSPLMVGCAFAINRQYFWELGGYDDGLRIWNGEQLEISFKTHLCGEGMFEIPCSRVAHTFRNKNYYKSEKGDDYVAKNLKRITEVWLDEYKHKVYENSPRRYANAIAGDLTQPKEVKNRLNCKPFRYYLEYVAPEMLERYPLQDPGYFAAGAIQSKVQDQDGSNFCIDTNQTGTKGFMILKKCHSNLAHPPEHQNFKLTWHRNIKHSKKDICLQQNLQLKDCHYLGGNQLWKFDLKTSQIINPLLNHTKCLSADITNKVITLTECQTEDNNQKWNWGHANISALENWEKFGVNLQSLYQG